MITNSCQDGDKAGLSATGFSLLSNVHHSHSAWEYRRQTYVDSGNYSTVEFKADYAYNVTALGKVCDVFCRQCKS